MENAVFFLYNIYINLLEDTEMKHRGIFACFAVLLGLMLAIGAAAYTFTPGSDAIVFVSDGGADTNSGADAAQAVKTLARAHELLTAQKGGTIVVCGVVTVADASGFAPADAGGDRHFLL